MIIHEDLRDLFRLLSDNGVEYVIVGGYAVAYHGYIRATKDVDILFRNDCENIARLIAALQAFGIAPDAMDTNTFSAPGRIVRIGSPPMMVELINAVSGVPFRDVWERKVRGQYGGVEVFFISKLDLLRNKKAAGRPQDIRDIEALGDADL